MWHLYIFMAVLAAGVVLKLIHPLMGRGRFGVAEGEGVRPARADRLLALALTVLVPLAAIFVYLKTGRPDLRGQPVIFSDFGKRDDLHFSLLAERPRQILLEQDADNLYALLSLAQINVHLGNHAESVKFYTHAVRVAAEQDDMRLRLYVIALGEAQVRANNGIVGDDALLTFAYATTMEERSPQARHYMALAQAQRGDRPGAVAEWQRLLHENPGPAYWKKMVRDALAATRADLRRDPQESQK